MISNHILDITPYFCLICSTQISYRKLWLAISKIVYYKVIKICGNSVIQIKLPPKRFKAERLNNFNHRASTSGFSYLLKRKWIRVSCYSSCLFCFVVQVFNNTYWTDEAIAVNVFLPQRGILRIWDSFRDNLRTNWRRQWCYERPYSFMSRRWQEIKGRCDFHAAVIFLVIQYT